MRFLMLFVFCTTFFFSYSHLTRVGRAVNATPQDIAKSNVHYRK